jgi:hypothetical protein
MTTSQDDQSTQNATGGNADGQSDGGKPDIDQLKHDIEQTRSELGETVDALSAKLDVKSRTKAKVGETKERAVGQIKAVQTKATTADGKPEPVVLAGAGGVVAVLALVTALIVWRKRR